MAVHQEKTFPFEWDGWDQQDMMVFTYYNAKFTNDFGVFKKDETFSSICIDYTKGIVEAYNENGSEVIKTQYYNCSPIN